MILAGGSISIGSRRCKSCGEALACTDPEKQQECLIRATAGPYWEKFACITGKLYLAQHRDQLVSIYSEGPDRFLPELFLP